MDYQRLRELTGPGRTFAVIGEGFIGAEIAAALAANGQPVVMILHGEGIGSRMYPPDLARFLNEYYRTHGVEVLLHGTAEGHGGRSGPLPPPAVFLF